ncbi:MAG: hypothetical protein Aurels2KO_40300 [Aureliella sp.]
MKGPGGDFAREITTAGRALAEAARGYLSQLAFAPDAIIASPAERTRQTSQIVCGDMAPEVIFDKHLYLASEQELVRFLRDLDDDWQKVLLIGHNNGISELVTFLSGAPCTLPTGSIARLSGNRHAWNYSVSRCLWKLDECWHANKTNSY